MAIFSYLLVQIIVQFLDNTNTIQVGKIVQIL